MKIAKADESRQAKKAILVSKNRLGLVESKKLAQVIKLEVEMDDDLWEKVQKVENVNEKVDEKMKKKA